MKSVSKMFCLAAMIGMGMSALASTSHAAISGPYSVDANTLHLWHINETALPVADAAVGTPISLASLGTGGGNALGAASYPGFGSAYSGVKTVSTGLYFQTPTNNNAGEVSTASFWNQTTGAFTYECIVRIDFDPVTNGDDYVEFISMDNEGNASRPFDFRLNPLGATGAPYQMEFYSRQNGIIGTTGTISIAQGHWYHAAVTYDGDAGVAGNLKFYWTDMGTQAAPDGSATVANLFEAMTLANDLTDTAGDLGFGGGGRGAAPAGQWLGLIDEVRISDIARGADQFIFVPEPSAIMLCAVGVALVGASRLRRRLAS